jgi:hypothetical protein
VTARAIRLEGLFVFSGHEPILRQFERSGMVAKKITGAQKKQTVRMLIRVRPAQAFRPWPSPGEDAARAAT